MTIDYALAQRLFTRHKGALTRAKKKADPQAVIDACDAFFAEFEEHDLPLPDSWSTWEVARRDATFAKARVEAAASAW